MKTSKFITLVFLFAALSQVSVFGISGSEAIKRCSQAKSDLVELKKETNTTLAPILDHSISEVEKILVDLTKNYEPHQYAEKMYRCNDYYDHMKWLNKNFKNFFEKKEKNVKCPPCPSCMPIRIKPNQKNNKNQPKQKPSQKIDISDKLFAIVENKKQLKPEKALAGKITTKQKIEEKLP